MGINISGSNVASGGGGGSFVTDNNNTPLIIGGGGGGRRNTSGSPSHGNTSTSGSNSCGVERVDQMETEDLHQSHMGAGLRSGRRSSYQWGTLWKLFFNFNWNCICKWGCRRLCKWWFGI